MRWHDQTLRLALAALGAGIFASISKFGDKDLTAAGSEAGFCARVIPGAR